MYICLKKATISTVINLCIIIAIFIIVSYSFPVIQESELQSKTLIYSGICADIYHFSEKTNGYYGAWIAILEFDDNIKFFFSPYDLRHSSFSELSDLEEEIIGKELQVVYLDRSSLYTGAKYLISFSDDETTYLSVKDFNKENCSNRALSLTLCLLIPIIKIIILWFDYFNSGEFRRLKKRIVKSSTLIKIRRSLSR